MIRFIVLAVIFRNSMAVIYDLNETDLYRMPDLYDLDDYPKCLSDPAGLYCIADFAIVPDDSELYNMTKEYSDYRLKHFNHTQVHRGICVTMRCKDYYLSNSTRNLNEALEACQNDTIWREYKLQVKLNNVKYCKKSGEKRVIDNYDVAVGIVYIILILLNVIGSIYGAIVHNKNEKSGNAFLLAFCMRRNWHKLVAPSGKGPDPRMERLKIFQGLRTMTMICVIFSHTVLVMAYVYVKNPMFIEKAYEDPLKQILFNGSLVTHTFFVMSSFLLAYNLMIHLEKHTINWLFWFKGIFLRWLRLTPVYALILATICTWTRHLGDGPMWDLMVTSETTACRQYWWAHLLYINNYIYSDALCAPQTWYLAADTQLFALGLLVCVACRTKRSRIIALSALFLVSIVIVVLHSYFQDLDAVVIQSPETYRELYANDNTFRLLYIRGHTNISTYTIGLAGGFIAYYWQNGRKDFTRFKRHRWFIWLMFPVGLGIILTGGIFYMDGKRVPLAYRVLYGAIYKPVFQFCVTVVIISSIFKFENTYRRIVEWRGFTWAGRVSYSAFLVHTLVQRPLVGGFAQPIFMTEYLVVVMLAAAIFMSFVLAAGLFLFVEAPAGGVTKALLQPARHKHTQPRPAEDHNGTAERVRG